MPSSLRCCFRTSLLAVCSLVLVGLSTSITAAQTIEPAGEIGASVSITAAGDAVRAAGARVSVGGTSARVKAAGAAVDVGGEVEEYVWAAGAEVDVDATVGDGLRALGARVVVRGRIDGDVLLGGALVEMNAVAGADVKVAGANVRLGPLTDIGGDLSAAGANVVIFGQINGGARLAGAVVTLNGSVDGDVSIHADRVIVGPSAVVGGSLLVRSLSEPEIAPGAQIAGEVIVEGPGEWFDKAPEASAPVIAAAFACSIFVIGLAFLIFARNTYSEAVDHVRFRPLTTLLYGVVSVLGLVAVSALLIATVVGIGLGIALLLLLPIAIALSLPVAAAGVVGWIFGRTVSRLEVLRLVFFLIVGALVIAFAGIIPFTGPWIVLAVLLFGLGGVLRAVLWRFHVVRTSDQGFGAATT